MTKTSRAFLVVCVVATSLWGGTQAGARDLPCRFPGQLEREVRCLARQPGLHPAGGLRYALSILDCEGGIDRRKSHYGGPWQLSAAEVRSFDNGISREWHRRINPMGLNNGYRQTVAVFWNSHDEGWSWSSCS